MPAVSPKQQRFFGWLKANPAEAQRRGISAKVADEFAHKPAGGYQSGARQPGDQYEEIFRRGSYGNNWHKGFLSNHPALKGIQPSVMEHERNNAALPPERRPPENMRGDLPQSKIASGVSPLADAFIGAALAPTNDAPWQRFDAPLDPRGPAVPLRGGALPPQFWHLFNEPMDPRGPPLPLRGSAQPPSYWRSFDEPMDPRGPPVPLRRDLQGGARMWGSWVK